MTDTTRSSGDTSRGDAAGGSGLKRNLSVWEAIGVSIALMAPSMAANINPQGTASVVGRAVPLAFALATVGVLLIAYTFVRLSQRFSHSGSVYGFVGATLGPRPGIIAGWLNAGTYLFYGVVTSMAAGRFINDLVIKSGLWPTAPDRMGYVFAWVALLVVWLLASRPAKGGTRVLFVVEAVTVLLILILTVIVLVHLLTGSAPQGQTFDLSVFTVSGAGVSTVFLGVVFGFLSFAGFEAAATLGEEAREPKRDIPRAILGTAIFGGLFFVIVTAVEVMAYGTDKAGIEAFINSGSLIGDLASSWVAPWLGVVITVGATFSAAACALATVVGASRLIFALSRDGLGPRPLAAVHERQGVPHRAVGASVAVIFVVELIAMIVGTPSLDLFVYSGTGGTLILLIAYGLATVGCVKLLFFSGPPAPGVKPVAKWELIIPILGLALLAYTLFRNVVPIPTGSALWGPGLSIGVLIIVLVVVLARPAAAKRAGERLTESEGLKTAHSRERD
ncbi:APC family permease [Microlunatus soli]|uniref:Amino acid transporter n=1 Tax=Microlunatus soli TaxID=630515 RepID=A0A1H1U279_9ACTN|nr:APC family permease [Microlunatus soli]SDS66572.1 Amino acid transporter [Microlunatus soli]